MVNKAARTRLFSFIRALKNMDVQNVPESLSERFGAVVVYAMALEDAGIMSPVVYNRIMTVATNVYSKKNREFYNQIVLHI